MDDGPGEIGESVEMLKQAAADGITSIICTPHMRHDMFDYPKETVDSHFAELKEIAAELGIGLYIGCEYHISSDAAEDFRNGRVHTLGDGPYILCEYAYSTPFEVIAEYTRKFTSCSFIPVIAHVERYRTFQEEPYGCEELRRMGALIQVNSSDVLGIEGRIYKKVTKSLLKNEIVDIIASDAHGTEYRRNTLKECRKYVEKKYSEEYARLLFDENPEKILEVARSKEKQKL